MLFLVAAAASRADEKITYDDQVTPIFRNNCFKCHNPDKAKGDLDLTTYSGVLKGGGAGKSVLAGDPSGSKLFKAITHTEEPFMPDKSPKLPANEIDVIKRWIAGGLLEKSSSKALASNKPKIDLTLGSVTKGRPAGPMPMPVDWLLEPVIRTEHATAVTALAANPWSPLLAVGGQHEVLVYHSSTLELLGVFPFPEGQPNCVRFSRNGKLLMVGGGRSAKLGRVVISDVATGERVVEVGNDFDTVLAADISSDQTKIALGGPTKRVKIFSTRDGQLLHDVKKHTDWVTAVEYSPDGVLLATGDRNGGLVVWEADSGQELYTLAGHQSAIVSVSWRDDSDILLSASEDGSVRLWEMREGRQVGNWNAHGGGVLNARFTHDGRIVSCGRDNQIAIWNGDGSKQRGWDFGGELPVRAAFSHDSTNVFATSWWGKIGVWTAADAKRTGDIASNPPTIAERLAVANKVVDERQTTFSKAAEGLATVQGDAAKIKTAMDTHDKTSPVFQFIEGQKQAQAGNRKAAEETNKELEKLKAVAGKSGAILTAAEGEAAKIQAALDKTEKFSEPYKLLTAQLDAANQKVAVTTAKANETAKAVTDRTAVATAATTDFTAKIKAAKESADKANASAQELTKQSDGATKTTADARTAADGDKTKLTEMQAVATQSMAKLTAAETELTTVNKTLESTDKNSPQYVEVSKQVEAATKLVADAKVAAEGHQKSLGDLRALADKSVAALVAAEAELAKIKASLDTTMKSFQASKDSAAQLEVAKNTTAETAKKEIDSMQALANAAVAALNTAKAEAADVQAKIEKTEKFSDAYKEMTKQLDGANKKVAEVRVPADHDRKEVADLQAVADKIVASIAAAEAEAAKVVATMAKTDQNYQKYQELEKQLDAANKKVTDAKAVSDKAQQDLTTAKAVVTQLKASQFYLTVYKAREELAAKQRAHDKLLASAAEAKEDNAKATKDLAAARKALDAMPAKVKALEAEVKKAQPANDTANAEFKKAQDAVAKLDPSAKKAPEPVAKPKEAKAEKETKEKPATASKSNFAGVPAKTAEKLAEPVKPVEPPKPVETVAKPQPTAAPQTNAAPAQAAVPAPPSPVPNPELETAKKLLAEKQAAAQNAAKQWELAKNNLAKAQTESADLAKRIKTLGETIKTTAEKIASAKVASEKSTKDLAAEKDRVEKLVAEHKRIKSGAPEVTKAAKR